MLKGEPRFEVCLVYPADGGDIVIERGGAVGGAVDEIARRGVVVAPLRCFRSVFPLAFAMIFLVVVLRRGVFAVVLD